MDLMYDNAQHSASYFGATTINPTNGRFVGMAKNPPEEGDSRKAAIVGISGRAETRMDQGSEHRPVTPGVAGSSPVHSAINSDDSE